MTGGTPIPLYVIVGWPSRPTWLPQMTGGTPIPRRVVVAHPTIVHRHATIDLKTCEGYRNSDCRNSRCAEKVPQECALGQQAMRPSSRPDNAGSSE
jgi:hypothetical protein